MSDDPVLDRLIEMQQKLDLNLARLDELERVFKQCIELTRAIIPGASPPPSAPRVN